MLEITSKMMNSENYKDRFIAEYFQVKIRLDRLKTMLRKWDEGNLDFTRSYSIYKEQVEVMEEYMDILSERASMEGIELVLPIEY